MRYRQKYGTGWEKRKQGADCNATIKNNLKTNPYSVRIRNDRLVTAPGRPGDYKSVQQEWCLHITSCGYETNRKGHFAPEPIGSEYREVRGSTEKIVEINQIFVI